MRQPSRRLGWSVADGTRALLAPLAPGLTCSHGEPWMGPHPLCEAHTEALCHQFEAAVARGEYDAAGYTASDRRRLAVGRGVR